MTILSKNELRKYILKIPEETVKVLTELLVHYNLGEISQERVVDNIKRLIESALIDISDSVGISLENNFENWEEEL